MVNNIRSEIAAYATMIGQLQASPTLKYANNYELLLDLGRPFDRRIDSKIERPKKHCFENCFHLLRSNQLDGNRDWYYCEGMARPPNCGGLSFDHAWLTTADGAVLDPTWDWYGAEATAYYGIAFTYEYALERALKTKVYGILGDVDLLRAGIPASGLVNTNSHSID